MKSQALIEMLERIIDKRVKKPFTLGRIDPKYTGGLPKILFDGDSQVSIKSYSYLSSYTPKANDRVLLVNIAGTHLVIGKIIS